MIMIIVFEMLVSVLAEHVDTNIVYNVLSVAYLYSLKGKTVFCSFPFMPFYCQTLTNTPYCIFNTFSTIAFPYTTRQI